MIQNKHSQKQDRAERTQYLPNFLYVDSTEEIVQKPYQNSLKTRSEPKTSESLKKFNEQEQKGRNIHRSYPQTRKNDCLKQREPFFSQSDPENQNGRMVNYISLPQLKLNNLIQFSFRLNDDEVSLMHQQQQQNNWNRGEIFGQQIRAKMLKLNQIKSNLISQCINLKKQCINFERQKKFLFDDFSRELKKFVIGALGAERKERERVSRMLEHAAEQLQNLQVINSKLEFKNHSLQQERVNSQRDLEGKDEELGQMQEEMAALLKQNEQYFDQTSQLQADILKLTEQANQKQALERELAQCKQRIQQLEGGSWTGMEDLRVLRRETADHRMAVELNIRQCWDDFNGLFDQLLPLSPKIKEAMAKVEGRSAYCTQLAQLKERAEEKIELLIDIQARNYLRLHEAERDDTLYQLYALVDIMSEVKSSVFGKIDPKKGLFNGQDYEKSIEALIGQCNRSLEGLNLSKSLASLAEQEQKQERMVTPQSDRFLKRSMSTLRTADSFHKLSNSYSESRFMAEKCSEQAKCMGSEGKLNSIKQRLQKLQRKVRTNLAALQ